MTEQELLCDDWEAISQGLAEVENGLYEPFAKVDAELRGKHNIPLDDKRPRRELDDEV